MLNEHPLACTEVKAMLPALALGALDGNERTRVMEHLDHCLSCREHYTQYAQVSQDLLGAVPQRIPPAALKRELLARVQPRRRNWVERTAGWLRGIRVAPRWAFSAILVLLLIFSTVLGSQVVQLTNEQAVLTQRLQRQERALAVLAGSSSEAITMAGTEVASDATALLRFDPQDTLAVFQVRDLPTSSADQSYQLWLIDSTGKRDSGAVFNIPAHTYGPVTLIVVAPRPLKDYARCGVSIEPRGGSPQPTGPTAMTGKLW